MDCPVCCEKITKINTNVTCVYCEYECCRNCVQNYILSKPIIPSCMNCNNEWNIQFLMSVCTKKFINTDYKKHRKQYLFEREQARFPEAQQLIETRKLRNEISAEIEGIKNLLRDKMNEFYTLNNRYNNRYIGDIHTKYIRRCPLDGCRGLLNNQWKCGICDNHICSKCNELKSQDHECDPGSLATAQLIRSDSKPCPSCGIYIHKLEGCNQMWCTDCNTAFDWRSGTIITGNIHNPHFFEARRVAGMQTRNVNDVPCGGIPTHNEFKALGFSNKVTFPRVIINLVCNIEGKIMNLPEPDTINNRIAYLDGKIDESSFKRSICMADKKYQKQREVDDVYRMASTTLSDILRQIITPDSGMDVYMAEKQVVDILNYSNSVLNSITNKYSSKIDYTIYLGYRVERRPGWTWSDLVYISFRKPFSYNRTSFKYKVNESFVPSKRIQ